MKEDTFSQKRNAIPRIMDLLYENWIPDWLYGGVASCTTVLQPKPHLALKGISTTFLI